MIENELNDETLEYLKKCMPANIIKCKDCVWQMEYGYKDGCWCRKLGLTTVKPDDYCSWAEKK